MTDPFQEWRQSHNANLDCFDNVPKHKYTYDIVVNSPQGERVALPTGVVFSTIAGAEQSAKSMLATYPKGAKARIFELTAPRHIDTLLHANRLSPTPAKKGRKGR